MSKSEWNRLDFFGIFVVVVSSLVIYAGLSKIELQADDVEEWLPVNSEARDRYDFFASHFQSDDFVVVTWPGCTVDDGRLIELTRLLRAKNSPLIQSITNGAEMVGRLRGELNLSGRSVYNRLKGILLSSEDPETTCMIVVSSKEGVKDRTAALKEIWDNIDRVDGLDRNDVVMGGYPFIGTQISEELVHANQRYLIPTIVLSTFFSFVCLRDLSLMMIVFVSAAGSAIVSIATIPLFGVTTGGLLSIIPALVFVLATSGSIHLIRYSLKHIGDPYKLLSIGWKPCVVSALTTSVGMFSLVRSNFPAIVNFGMFCAIGVITSVVFQLIIVPWLLMRFGENGLRKMSARTTDTIFWELFCCRVRAVRWIASTTFIGLMLICIWGLTLLTANVEVENMFRKGSSLRIQLARLENQLGPLDQTELLIIFDADSSDLFHERVDLVRKLQFKLRQNPEIANVYSLVNFLPGEPKSRNLTSIVRRDSYRAAIRNQRENLANGGLLKIDEQAKKEIWRLSMRFPFSQRLDFRDIENQVLKVADEVIQSSARAGQVEFVYTGKTHLFNHAQHSLLSDLFKNFLLAFVIITPMLMVALRSIVLGLISMIPNVFPAVVVFGSLGWIGIPVDLAIAMTACVALGIAVDDTTHFMVRFRDFGGSLTRIYSPIRQAISQCGPAMIGTTLIAGGGLIVYAASHMTLISNFAIFIVLMLGLALVADLFMLPGLLFCLEDKQSDARAVVKESTETAIGE